MSDKNYKLKRDKYRKARGGYSRFLTVSCANCEKPLLLYQKDGPGPLKRLYLDRIFAPEYLSDLKDKVKPGNLSCTNCKTVIGTPIIYEKENRKSLHLIQGSFTKKISKGTFR